MANRKTNKLENMVEEVINRKVGNTAIILGYFEHQVDLLAKLVQDLSALIDPEQVTPEIQQRLDQLELLLAQSSIDFSNLETPLQSYKLPGTLQMKTEIRNIQNQYLQGKINRNEF